MRLWQSGSNRQAVVALDITALDPTIARLYTGRSPVHSDNTCSSGSWRVRSRPDLHLAALLRPCRVHSDGGSPLDVEGRSTSSSLRRARPSRTAAPRIRISLVDRGLWLPDLETRRRQAGWRERLNRPMTMSAATSCTANIWDAITQSIQALSEARPPRVDFRCVSFPTDFGGHDPSAGPPTTRRK